MEPTYNHTREDSELSPCEICEIKQSMGLTKIDKMVIIVLVLITAIAGIVMAEYLKTQIWLNFCEKLEGTQCIINIDAPINQINQKSQLRDSWLRRTI